MGTKMTKIIFLNIVMPALKTYVGTLKRNGGNLSHMLERISRMNHQHFRKNFTYSDEIYSKNWVS